MTESKVGAADRERRYVLLDAHSHMDGYDEGELKSAFKEISEYRIFTISNSTDLRSYERNLEIASRCDLVLATFGIHPARAFQYVDRLQDLSKPIQQSPMIGEIGLDFHWVKDTSQYPAERKVFEFFLERASQQKKIVNLHTKGAEKEILDLLRDYDIQRAIIHWYSGPLDILQVMAERGFYFTVGIEVVCSSHIQAIARDLPSELILTEMDNPGGQKWLMGNLGMPRGVEDVVQKLAELRETSAQAIAETVQANFVRLAEGDPWLSDICGRVFGQT